MLRGLTSPQRKGQVSEVSEQCRLCASTGPHKTMTVPEMYYGTKEPFEYFTCAQCDSLQIVNALEGEELARHYPSDYYSYNTSPLPSPLLWVTKQRDRFLTHTGGLVAGGLITAIPRSVRVVFGINDSSGDVVEMLGELGIAPDARILDVGCGSGGLLDRLARAGFKNLSGADPFLAADGETPLGVPLAKRYLDEIPGEFDLIMFNHSFEHMPDPGATLKAARKRLSAAGACLVRLPTTSSEVCSLYGVDWVGIDAPRHIFIPSRPGMAEAAEAAGLMVDRTFDDSSFVGFLGSEAYRRDISLSDPQMFWKVLKSVGFKQVWSWQRRAERLNRQGRGDWAGFVLRPA